MERVEVLGVIDPRLCKSFLQLRCCLRVTTNIVDLTNTALFKNFTDSPAVITYMQPTLPGALAVHRQCFAF